MRHAGLQNELSARLFAGPKQRKRTECVYEVRRRCLEYEDHAESDKYEADVCEVSARLAEVEGGEAET